jgi:hypothetical protein
VRRAVEIELATLARKLPMFVPEDDAGKLLRLDARSVRRHAASGDLVHGVPGTITRVSLLAKLARQYGYDLDDLEPVLQALAEPERLPAGQLALLPPAGDVGTVDPSTTT